MGVTEPAPNNAMSAEPGVLALFVQLPAVSHALPAPLPGPLPLPLQPNVAACAACGTLKLIPAAMAQSAGMKSEREMRREKRSSRAAELASIVLGFASGEPQQKSARPWAWEAASGSFGPRHHGRMGALLQADSRRGRRRARKEMPLLRPGPGLFSIRAESDPSQESIHDVRSGKLLGKASYLALQGSQQRVSPPAGA
jgi:hypothetical protein